MRRWMIGATAASALALVGASAQAGSSFPFYQEQGDAGGSFSSPQAIGGGTFFGIEGSIGGCVGSGCGSGGGNEPTDFDGYDYYLFGWGGGAFGMQLSFNACDGVCEVSIGDITATLYDTNQNSIFSVISNSGIFGTEGLAAGNYVVEIASGFDPPFLLETFTFDGQSIVRGPITGPDQVPEPASLAILGLGLAGLGLTMRRRRTA